MDCRGFHADTMHMARLWDSSGTVENLSTGKGEDYSLESLTGATLPPRTYFHKFPYDLALIMLLLWQYDGVQWSNRSLGLFVLSFCNRT